MSNWIDKFKILAISTHKQHIIVADRDNLFEYLELRKAFENEGYAIIVSKTDLDVRVQFELQVRESVNRFLIVAPANYRPLPDLEMQVHFQSVGLAQLFLNLDAKAIKGLSFNALSLLSNIKHYDKLSYDKSVKFLLENLYSVDFDILTKSKAKERILNALITVLLEKNGVNNAVVDFLTGFSKPYFPGLISKGLTKTNLLKFIQEQWELFVESKSPLLDFNEALLNRSLGYLFAFEYLKPVKVLPANYESFHKALKIGVYVDEHGQNDNELEGLIEYLKQQLELIEDIADQWFKTIQILSNAKIRYLISKNSDLKDRYSQLENAFNNRFQRFIENTYGSLFSLSGVRKPVVVSRILEHIKAKPAKKKALLVIDCMSYWQWTLLSNALANAGVEYSSNASLAFIPTITAWSRQAIFKGEKPDLNDDNSKESKMFESFWLRQGAPAYQIHYQKFSVNEPLSAKDISDDVTLLGLVCNDLDNIMHGSILGNDHLKVSTEQWIEKSGIVKLILDFKVQGFEIYITADHGNVEAKGVKNLNLEEKVGSLSRSKRHLHFTSERLLENFKTLNPSLPVGTRGFSVYLKNDEAFTLKNKQVITHGGSHFWEVIVPFISI
ncbi:BREX-3 system phosphatase PglZ [Fulvivirgaceae bacterium PWU5]|uniref:BREX-3 system phosphatase PglZ n=1 Tax=Dawidia cretensis TaxID=2782350 RepID=A0AAP2DTQ9_9BACT|nr:BREX-3 system phosphatase PglZ [Dawidia cretensis]MBT1707290.1 BREX-3 system phosphatase PglZ [Dawidia cretensis]